MQGNKYRNIKSEYNGVVYDSRKEMRRAATLELYQRAGAIRGLERQKKFVLQDKFTDRHGDHIREIAYFADFYYWDNTGEVWVAEDVKSPATRQDPVYRIKKKMFLYKYPEIKFLET